MENANDGCRLPSSLVAGHKQFLQNAFPEKEHLFAQLAEQQLPKVMWIGCSDSRVAPELILGAEPGELFILRNIGNMVPPVSAGEASVGSAIAFAVNQLNVDFIVICGHSDCGGMKALRAHSRTPMHPMIASWVKYAAPALDEVGEEAELTALVKAHVVNQEIRLMEYECVAAAVAAGQLTLHACFYDIATGRLEEHDPETRAWKVVVA